MRIYENFRTVLRENWRTYLLLNLVVYGTLIATMIVTEYLPVSIRFPVVVLLIVLVSGVWSSVLLRQIRVLVRQPLADVVGHGVERVQPRRGADAGLPLAVDVGADGLAVSVQMAGDR